MTVHFIGAGPGAVDLITVRGLNLIRQCPVCLYAGSLVPEAIVAAAPHGARVIDTAPLTLDAIIAEIAAAHAKGLDVARIHSGDPSLYGAIAEQMRRLAALGYTVQDFDGHFDFDLRDAVRELQQRFGVIPDGYPSRAFLDRLGALAP